MTRWFLPLVGLVALSSASFAQSDDAAYCSQLAALAYKYFGMDEPRRQPQLF